MDNFSRSNIKTIRDLVYTAAQRFGDDPFVRTRVKKEMVDKSFNTFKREADAMGVWLQKNFGRRMHAAVIGSTSYERDSKIKNIKSLDKIIRRKNLCQNCLMNSIWISRK